MESCFTSILSLPSAASLNTAPIPLPGRTSIKYPIIGLFISLSHEKCDVVSLWLHDVDLCQVKSHTATN